MKTAKSRKTTEETPENIRPWGRFDVIDEGPGYKVKRITVNPGARLSYQKHNHRHEYWMVVAGRAHFTINDAFWDLKIGQTARIAAGDKHRVENLYAEPLLIIEIQIGDYLGEDDIERFEDDYGRIAV